VKCLVRWRPDDDAAMRATQGAQLKRLFEAARASRHELLVEIITESGGAAVAAAMGQIYDLGVRPDWWKLEPAADWAAVDAAIRTRDPLCRGVLMLGQAAGPEALNAAFRAAAPFDVVRGFAVGRTIFEAPARAWLAGEIDDMAATQALASGFGALVGAWRAAKAEARERPAAE
jgi:5-dehydro-2-deoxygluconokinase